MDFTRIARFPLSTTKKTTVVYDGSATELSREVEGFGHFHAARILRRVKERAVVEPRKTINAVSA